MCSPDPNAGARRAAKAQHSAKVAKYNSASLKYWNRETSYIKGKDTSVIGFSRQTSDAYQKALQTLSAGKVGQQNLQKSYLANQFKSRAFEGGRSRTAGSSMLRNLLHQSGEIEHGIDMQFGRNLDTRITGATRAYQGAVAKYRKGIGGIPEFGPPTMIPPKDRMGQFLNTLQTSLSIGSTIASGGADGGFLFGGLGSGNRSINKNYGFSDSSQSTWDLIGEYPGQK